MVSPMAETTTTTSSPAFWASTTRRATRLMPSASATEDPPNFWTTSDTAVWDSGVLNQGGELNPHNAGVLARVHGTLGKPTIGARHHTVLP